MEFIISVTLFSIILIVVTNNSLVLYHKNTQTSQQTYLNLQLEATQAFIKKHHPSHIVYKENSLYFENHLLLEKVSLYTFSQKNHLVTINICVEDNSFCQKWKFNV